MLYRKLMPLVVLLVALTVGTLGYRFIEGNHWSLFDAFYMTTITLTTVGFLEVHELSPLGWLFTAFLCLTGVFTLFYFASEFIRTIVSGEIQQVLGKRQMERSLAGVKDHLIVCGFGRMGRLVCEEFEREKLRYVVIDRREDLAQAAEFRYGIPLSADATSDVALRQAGIGRARGLVTVLSTDADNLYIVLSARLLNEKLFIVARSEDAVAEAKLRRVGANRVVSPYHIGGVRVAQAVLRPAVVDFIELATGTEHLDLQIEEASLTPTSALVGRLLRDSDIRSALGIIVVAIKQPDGAMIFNPPGEHILASGETLIVLGHRDHLDQLEKLACG